jgi:hypothetical protein
LGGGNLIFVFMELMANGFKVLVSWLPPVTEALFRDWIILLVVHASNGLNVRFLDNLSNDLVNVEELFLWDLAILRLVEKSHLLSGVVVEMMEKIGDPAGISGTEEGKKCKFIHFN